MLFLKDVVLKDVVFETHAVQGSAPAAPGWDPTGQGSRAVPQQCLGGTLQSRAAEQRPKSAWVGPTWQGSRAQPQQRMGGHVATQLHPAPPLLHNAACHMVQKHIQQWFFECRSRLLSAWKAKVTGCAHKELSMGLSMERYSLLY